MTNFEKMYYRLMNQVSDAIDLLKMAQLEGEQAFIDAGEEAFDSEFGEKRTGAEIIICTRDEEDI